MGIGIVRRLSLAWTMTVATLGALFVASTLAVDGDVIRKATLDGVGRFRAAHARAFIIVWPRHVEVALNAQALTMRRDKPFLVWMGAGRSRGIIAGAFRRNRSQGFSGAIVVPGSRRVALRNSRAARLLVITRVRRGAARRIVRDASDGRSTRKTRIRGRRILAGRLHAAGADPAEPCGREGTETTLNSHHKVVSGLAARAMSTARS